jgi:surface antigen
MRKLKMRTLIIGAVLTLGITGCVTNPSNEDVGRIVGTITGAGVGSLFGGGTGNTVMTVIGGIAGYVVGGHVGRGMDHTDQERAGRHLRQGFDQPGSGTYNDSWQGGSGAHIHSRVTTHPYHQDNRRRDCRSFVEETTIRIHGRPETARRNGTACLEYSRQYPRGLWVIQQ